MKRLLFSLVAMLFCSATVFAQTEISTTEEFLAIQANGNYILTADINLGDRGERTSAIIPTFSGTFNGNGKTITYQASFTGSANSGNYGLFGYVSGTIDSLNVQGNVTLSGTGNTMNVGLLCGTLSNSGTIEYCNVSGNVNSTVNPADGDGSDAGLIVGESSGEVSYCIGSGNVVGVGYAGGLIGQMQNGSIAKACSFSGSVTANNPSDTRGENGYGSYAGGICGAMRANAEIIFCVVNADIQSESRTSGVGSTAGTEGFFVIGATQDNRVRITLTNSYASGNLNGVVVGEGDITNTTQGEISGNYYEGYENKTAAEICALLEAAREAAGDDEFYFDVVNGEVVLIIGQRQIVCESPIGLTVSIENGTFAANWSVANQDNSYVESIFAYSITGGASGEQVVEGTISGTSLTQEGQIPPSENPYVFTVKSKCDTEFSNALTYTFYVNENCTPVNALQASDVTATSANITWQGEAEEVKLNGETVEFDGGNTLALENLTPATTYTIEVIVYCPVDGEDVARPTSVTFITHGVGYETKQSGRFNDPNTWLDNVVPQGDVATITINTGHRVTVDHNLKITDNYKIAVNNGVLQITQQGQLINTTDANVPGIVEIVSPQKSMNSWTFIGAPFGDTYKLGTIYPMSHDISVSKYDYPNAKWSESWAHVETEMEAGEGYFAWPFYDGAVIFTTFGDVWDYTAGKVGNYVFNGQTATNLNNTDVEITKTITESEDGGRWMALANPYPAKLSVDKFTTANNMQGQGIYRLTSNTSNGVQTYTFVPLVGDIAMTEGFFVNLASGNQVRFSKEQLTDYPTTEAKSQVAPREFVELSLVKGNYKSKLYFAHNQEAEQNYDIFDANKLFALGEVAEPYFVTDGIALVKEEAKELPYYATMNVRSFANDTVSFVVNNIPEGLAVSIIDGENVIDMVEGGVYTTEILTGENADRFKVLIKKSVSISDVEELEVNITNNNRHISIATTETDLQVEVYNTLGQKVLSTKDRNFTLNQVSAGAYLIKAFNNKASKTQKIVVK